MRFLLADIVYLLHIFILLFVTIVPFTNYDTLILMNLVFMFGILFHWIINDNTCAFTMLEMKLRGLDSDETFFGKLFGKLYTFGKDERITWLILVFLIILSTVKSLKNNTLQRVIECLQSRRNS